ncbi:MAG: hypothetical protein H6982_11900 [Chromatiales bacterium]|nr:hypothetical protein [Chromatiales bacterium]
MVTTAWLRSPRASLVSASVVLGAAALGLPLQTLPLAALLVVVWFLALLPALVMRRWPRVRTRLARIGIWLACTVAIGATAIAQDRAARDTGDTVVTACEAYRKRTAAYPRTLADLVPTELPAVPDALALPLVRRAFRYRTTTDGFELDYPSPLMTLHLYTSAAARWQALD